MVHERLQADDLNYPHEPPVMLAQRTEFLFEPGEKMALNGVPVVGNISPRGMVRNSFWSLVLCRPNIPDRRGGRLENQPLRREIHGVSRVLQEPLRQRHSKA